MYNALLKILTGNGLASLISMISVTIIARLYTTEDLGEFYLFVASAQVFTIVLCFRYEQAIVLCKLKKSTDRLVMYCIFQSVINTTIIIIGIYIGHKAYPGIAWIEVATSNFHLYFLSLLAVSINQIYINVCLRENKIGIISCNLVLNASLVAIFDNFRLFLQQFRVSNTLFCSRQCVVFSTSNFCLSKQKPLQVLSKKLHIFV